jgi:hypothetical protein
MSNSISNLIESSEFFLSLDDLIIRGCRSSNPSGVEDGIGIGIGDGPVISNVPLTQGFIICCISNCQINQESHTMSGIRINDNSNTPPKFAPIPYKVRGCIANNTIDTKDNSIYLKNGTYLEIKYNQLTSSSDIIRLDSSKNCRILNNKFNLVNNAFYAINSSAGINELWLSNLSNMRSDGSSPYFPDFKSESISVTTSNPLSNLYY